MLYADEEGEVFLGHTAAKVKHMSDETARAIDEEIKLLIDRNYSRAESILMEHIDILHSMKDALMKYETIDAKQIDDLMARREVREPADWANHDSTGSGGSTTQMDVNSHDEPKSGPAEDVPAK